MIQTRKVIFSAKRLEKSYQVGEVLVHALRGIDLDLYDGEFVVFLGLQVAASQRCSTFSAV